MKKLIILISAFLFLHSCTQSKKTAIAENDKINIVSDSIDESEVVFALNENEINTENIDAKDSVKLWLESLFQCRNGNQFCFYLETEEKATTKRFYQFMIDSEQIYGATNLSDEEMPIAEKNYQEKWSNIYPLRKDMEPWLFGRAQDDMEPIKEVKIEKIASLKYRVFVDYGDQYQTLNLVTLVNNGSSYLIDYCETEFLN